MVCAECTLNLPEDSFYRDRSRPRGKVARCKGCYSARQKRDRARQPRRRFSEAKGNAIRRGLRWELTFEQYVDWIYDGPCFFCGTANCAGIDRLNNEPFYSPANAVTCCGTCNAMKGKMTMHDFFERVLKIADRISPEPVTANPSIALDGRL